MSDHGAFFTLTDDPDLPGWRRWRVTDDSRFHATFGAIHVRNTSDRVARVRMVPERHHSNSKHSLHGGVLLAFVDQALFVGARALGMLDAEAAVTLDLSAQFIGTTTIGRPIEAEVEVLRETGRLLFLRGLVVQGDATLASFTGTVRKPSVARA